MCFVMACMDFKVESQKTDMLCRKVFCGHCSITICYYIIFYEILKYFTMSLGLPVRAACGERSRSVLTQRH